jgi:DNA polymerase-3 subunit gamma/tau
MFENILGQSVIAQLIHDIEGDTLAPSILFAGPPASGKGSTALELARVLSCREKGGWGCSCPSCRSHRGLDSQDMLVLGPRPFSAEIAACKNTLAGDPENPVGRLLFLRSIQKLLLRFSPVLWDNEVKLKKISPIIADLNEGLEIFSHSPERAAGPGGEQKAGPEEFLKAVGAIAERAFELEAEGIAAGIPIAQIRRAAYWSRLAPGGRRKILIIENADGMQDQARNALLKILEEPPPTLSIVLCAVREGDLLPTIRSRLRVYRFVRRERAAEEAVLRRVFRDKDTVLTGSLMDYLNSFLPPSEEELLPLAAWFMASAAAGAFAERAGQAPPRLLLMGKYASPLAGQLGRPADMGLVVRELLKRTDRFRIRGLFDRFLSQLLRLISGALKEAGPGEIAFRQWALERIREAAGARDVYNQDPALALERLFVELKEALASDGPDGRTPLFLQRQGGL